MTAPTCPHRRYSREPTHYQCRECPHTLPLGEAETEAVVTWQDEHDVKVLEDACRK
jgi:hypothetical protein